MTDLKAFLRTLHENLNILREREGKYGGNAPLDLLNQISDHQTAIALTEQAIVGELTEAEWREALRPLLVFPPDIHSYDTQPPALPPAEAKERHELDILLKNVETSWINGVLEKSVHHAVLLDLGKEIRADAIDHPWEMVLGRPDELNQPLPAGTKISDVFDETPLLLILGEPGSGKTITLLELARDLISRVRSDPNFTQPVPVILNLSTWTDQQQPLNDWVIKELSSKYRTPRQLGRSWLEERRILPLLDGLDEVKRENRAACVEAINRFSADYGLQGLAVCSRIEDYSALPVRLKFSGAIYILPLADDQIDAYLAGAGGKLESLRTVLQQDEPLRTLARSPLMLNIMSLAYQETSTEKLTSQPFHTVETRRKALFEVYVRRMFERRSKARPYDDKPTKTWLGWLAHHMRRHHQELFLIDQLQPSWLQAHYWRWAYTLTSRLMGGLIIGLLFELFFLLVYGLNVELKARLIVGLIYGLIGGLSVGLIDLFRLEWFDERVAVRNLPGFFWSGINILVIWLIFGLTYGLVFGLIIGQNTNLLDELLSGTQDGIVFGVIFGLRGSRQSLTKDIQTIEALRWSWPKSLRGLVSGLIFGPILALLTVLIIGLEEQLKRGPDVLMFRLCGGGLFFGLISGTIGAVFNGLSHEIIETKTTPNQGIWLSLRNAIFGGLIVGLSLGMMVGLLFGLLYELFYGLNIGLNIGLILGLIGALWYGGLDLIQHYTLRLILIILGHTPGNYARFLDYAAERIFLRKVGGGYIFIHRSLMEYFASLIPADIEQLSTELEPKKAQPA